MPVFTFSNDGFYNYPQIEGLLFAPWGLDELPVYLKPPHSKGEPIIVARAVGKPQARKSLADLEPPHRAKRPESLTSREQEILELIWAGFKNREIGHRLKISVKTVEAHREHIKTKLSLDSSGELLRYAIEHGRVES